MIKLTIPVYHTIVRKTKKDKTFLVSLNWYRNAYYYEQNNVKAHFHHLIKKQLGEDQSQFKGEYEVTYKYYYKNAASDLANVTPMCSKWINDVLQELEIVENDNVQYLTKEVHEVVAQDKNNPRCEITITEKSVEEGE